MNYFVRASMTDQGVARDQDALQCGPESLKEIIDWIGTTNKATIVFESTAVAQTTYTLTTSETVPSNITLRFWPGAVIDGAGTLTLDSSGQIWTQPDQNIFGSSITVVFTNGGEISLEWFGAVGGGVTDDSAAISAAYTSLAAGGGVVRLSAKTYRVVSQVLVNGTRINIKTIGVGGTTFNESGPPYHGSTFYCNNTSTTFFHFDGNDALEHSGPVFEHVNFVGSSKTSTIALQLEDVNRWTLRNVSFRGFDIGLQTLDTNDDASWGYISQPIMKDCNTGYDLNSSVSMFGGDIEPASGGIGIKVADDWSSSKIVGVKFDGASAATGIRIIGYRNIVSSSVFEGCDPAIYIDHDGAGHAFSGEDNRIIGCTIFGSDGTETGITIEANALRNQLWGNFFGNCATNVDDSGTYTTRLDYEEFDFGPQNGVLSTDATGYWENFMVVKGTGSYPFLELTDTHASGHQYRVRTYLDNLIFKDETSGDGLIQIDSGSSIHLGETSDPTGVANVGLLYTKDNGSGKTQLCVKFASGAVQIIATEP